MTRRERNRRPTRSVSAPTYWALFRWSPLIMLAGMVAGGWLAVRSILVWGVNDGSAQAALDIPFAAVILLCWVWSVVALLRPPRQVLALRGRDVTSPALIWPLGRTIRVWSMTSAPLTGLLASLAWAPIPLALGLLPDSSLNLWPALPLAVAITAFSVALIWMSLRSAIAGVELTPTTLIARGFFVTRRYHREQLRSATSVTLGWWQVFLFGVMRLSP